MKHTSTTPRRRHVSPSPHMRSRSFDRSLTPVSGPESQSPVVKQMSLSPPQRQKYQKYHSYKTRHTPSPSQSPRYSESSPVSFARNDADSQSPIQYNRNRSPPHKRYNSHHREHAYAWNESPPRSPVSPSERKSNFAEERRSYKYGLSKRKGVHGSHDSEKVEYGPGKTVTNKVPQVDLSVSPSKGSRRHEISETRQRRSYSQSSFDRYEKGMVEPSASQDVEYGPGRLDHGSLKNEYENDEPVWSQRTLSREREESKEQRRRHSEKRKPRRDEDEESILSTSSEEKREAKRRKKEEKRLRKEEKRRRREERHRRREERRANKAKAKEAATRAEPEGDSCTGDEIDDNHHEAVTDHKSHDEEMEDEQQRLETELRRKALESLRAKKAISH
eukprot:TRINITY_DN1509_c0_g1_i4.p1 TRINITY_DN1509_c0_g1~~TRINITY_DN1509_c0_g1_i4.p1  ORF type:complete len:390 (-),score=99.09 TRINITY_DN1509_c0_g1_i4:605-1774(-)